MPETITHEEVEQRFRALLASQNLPAPDEVAHLSRCVIFVWHDTKSLILIDLDEVDPDHIGEIDLCGGAWPEAA